MKHTPELQTTLESLSDKYHTDGVHFEHIKSRIWVLLNYGMSWVPTKAFDSLSSAVAWTNDMLGRHRTEAAEFERAGG